MNDMCCTYNSYECCVHSIICIIKCMFKARGDSIANLADIQFQWNEMLNECIYECNIAFFTVFLNTCCDQCKTKLNKWKSYALSTAKGPQEQHTENINKI